MRHLRATLFAAALLAALGLDAGMTETGLRAGLSSAHAQAQSERLTTRMGRWTRARFEAAKKHWAEHERWFSECNRELASRKQPGRRMSYDRQAHFLEDCMRRKH